MARIAASCPAPEGSSTGSTPAAAIARRSGAGGLGVHRHGLVAPARQDLDLARGRRRPRLRRRSCAVAISASSRSASGARRSAKSSTRPGIVLVAPGRHVQPADGGHGAGERRGRRRARRRTNPAAAAEGVRPQRHRHRARVAAAAGEDELDPGHPGDRRDEPERGAPGGERRALLDVRLDEARRRRSSTGPEGRLSPSPSAANASPSVTPSASTSSASSGSSSPKSARDPKTPRPNRGPLLEPEGDDGDRAPGAAGGVDRLGDVEGRDDAQRAVEAPAVRRGVEVRSGPDLGRRRVGAGRAGRTGSPRRRRSRRGPPRASSRRPGRGRAARPRPGRAGSCRRRGRSRRARRAAR